MLVCGSDKQSGSGGPAGETITAPPLSCTVPRGGSRRVSWSAFIHLSLCTHKQDGLPKCLVCFNYLLKSLAQVGDALRSEGWLLPYCSVRTAPRSEQGTCCVHPSNLFFSFLSVGTWERWRCLLFPSPALQMPNNCELPGSVSVSLGDTGMHRWNLIVYMSC